SGLVRHATAVVSDKNKISDFTLALSGAKDRARFSLISVNRVTGTVSFDIIGQSATPNASPNGDTTINATGSDGKTKGSAQVIVVIPAAIGTPHPTFDGIVSGENRLLSKKTSPAAFNTPDGDVLRAVSFDTRLEIAVLDQFGKPLDVIYAGVP